MWRLRAERQARARRVVAADGSGSVEGVEALEPHGEPGAVWERPPVLDARVHAKERRKGSGDRVVERTEAARGAVRSGVRNGVGAPRFEENATGETPPTAEVRKSRCVRSPSDSFVTVATLASEHERV